MSADEFSRLALGSAQFGLDYGIANPAGKVAIEEATEILSLAKSVGIRLIDTAPTYGSAQALLGRLIGLDGHFDFVTKTLPVGNERIGEPDLARIAAAFEDSLKHLGRERLAAVMVHHAADLLKPGGDRLYDLMRRWQVEGRVGKIGASVYERAQIEALLERHALDLIQLPLNIFDQRLLRDGVLAALAKQGIEIHVRSVFLQGLLLMEGDALPAYFMPWQDHLRQFHAYCRSLGISPLTACLGFVLGQPEVAKVIIGVVSASQLAECIAASRQSLRGDWSTFALDSLEIIDPRRWPQPR
ncbi:aldo/keto reductase [Sulfuricystis multivorans]|uniref:aldo/keto reductase n=1 Tax=Sulfuricystis multivorans TaxID=2211108 RepID=UPI000F8447AD|nr:aldo/keto reductase [Sulfuricystis multivorans]